MAESFDDVYFSNASGLEESRYVFLHNNHLPDRWQQCDSGHFVVAESGFGTGLNFLATWEAWENWRKSSSKPQPTTLYFISVEKYPLNVADLRQALAQWPQLHRYALQLLTHYPLAIPGCHRLRLAEDVILDLHLGDIADILPTLHCPHNGLVDAWYLDGFAPAKNPQMWTQTLFDHMARLARKQCTFSTFTAAGFVKRGLQQAGFTVEKRKGFGRKRDMLSGIVENQRPQHPESYYYRNSAINTDKPPEQTNVAIVGAGLAAANCALSLCQRGYNVDLFAAGKALADGASGNPMGGFYPQLNAQANHSSQLYAASFLFAQQRYQQLLTQGFDFAHQWCGALQLAFNDNVAARQSKLAQQSIWPADLIRQVDQNLASELAGLSVPYSALWIEKAGWIAPQELVKALIDAATQQGELRCSFKQQLQQLVKVNNRWRLIWQDGSHHLADIVIIACGHQSVQLDQLQYLPLRAVRGQVERIATQPSIEGLKTLLCHKGYFTPAFNGEHALGSTYIKGDTDVTYRQTEQQINLQMQTTALNRCDWAHSIGSALGGRAAVRCSSPDHLPLAGAVPDFDVQKSDYAELYKAKPPRCYPRAADHQNLYTLTALGSRGLVSAPLLAEVIACQISGQPLPLNQTLLNAVNPNRFLIRQLIRREIG